MCRMVDIDGNNDNKRSKVTILCNLSTVRGYQDTCERYHECRGVLKCQKIFPQGTEHPRSTHDIPHGTHDIHHGAEHPHSTYDIPHSTHDIPHGIQDIPNVLNPV